MADWFNGKLKINGEHEDISRFLKDELVRCKNYDSTKVFRFAQAKRGFVMHETIPDFENTLTINYSQAWQIDYLYFQYMSNKYDLTFRIQGRYEGFPEEEPYDVRIVKSLDNFVILKRREEMDYEIIKKRCEMLNVQVEDVIEKRELI